MKLLQLASTVLAATMAVAQTFDSPVIYEDLADIEVIRVGDTYYYTASTMHYSPGASVLKSYDLINWEFIGHSVPELTFGENLLPEQHRKGVRWWHLGKLSAVPRE